MYRDNVGPYLYRAYMFSCPTIGHFFVLDPFLMFLEGWGDFVHYVNATNVVCEFMAVSVEYDVTLPEVGGC